MTSDSGYQEVEELKAKLAYAEEILASVASCRFCATCQEQAEAWFDERSSYRLLATVTGKVNGRWWSALLAVSKLLKRADRVIDEALGHRNE